MFFTLENTAPTTVHVLPGMNYTLPLAGLLLLVAGVGAVSAWFFAAWTGMLNNVERITQASEFEARRIQNSNRPEPLSLHGADPARPAAGHYSQQQPGG